MEETPKPQETMPTPQEGVPPVADTTAQPASAPEEAPATPASPPPEPSSPPPAKGKMIWIIVVILALIALGYAAYVYSTSRNTSSQLTSEILPTEAAQAPEPTEVPMTDSDAIEDIQKDLDNTKIVETDSEYDSVSSDIEGL